MSLVRFWWHSDIQGLQADLKKAVDATAIAVNACTALDAATRAEWQAWLQGADDFIATDAAWINTGTQADRGQKYTSELVTWQQRLSKVCAVAVSTVDPARDQPTLTNVNQALRYAAIAAGFLGTAYVVGKVAEFIPKPRRA